MYRIRGESITPKCASCTISSVGSADNWWLRSANADNANNAGYVNTNGNVNNNRANNTNGCSPAFAGGFLIRPLCLRALSLETLEVKCARGQDRRTRCLLIASYALSWK